MKRLATHRGSPGFTLIELVVAAMVSLLVIAGLYVVYAAHTRVFRNQEMVSQAQVSARYAMEMVKEDLRRAGAMAVSDTNDPQVAQRLARPLSVSGARIMSVALEHGVGYVPDVGIHLGVGATRPTQEPDRLTLVGNFTNNERYWVANIAGVNVTLQNTSRFDPSDPFPPDETTFNEIFPNNSSALARIEHGDKVFFSRITGREFGSSKVVTADAASICLGSCEGATLNVVNKVRYAVIQADLTVAEKAISATNKAISTRADLVREILNWETNAVIRREVVAENVVDFQVWFLFDANENPQTGPAVDQRNFALLDTDTGNAAPCNAGALGSVSCQVKNAHAAVVRISVRTPREDPRFPVPVGMRSPLQWYDIDTNAVGAARVRTLISQVALTNIEYLDY
jgi:type II secretory pathway pseudopilin PulG